MEVNIPIRTPHFERPVSPRHVILALFVAFLAGFAPLHAQDATDIIRGRVVGPDKKPVAGTWNIAFNVAKVPAGNAYLTIPVAGGPGDVTVLLNGQEVGRVTHNDDASVRRAMPCGAQPAPALNEGHTPASKSVPLAPSAMRKLTRLPSTGAESPFKCWPRSSLCQS